MISGTFAQYGFKIENVSGEDIPPRSAVLVTGTVTSDDNRSTWSTVTRYDGTPGNIMVTGPGVIPSKVTAADGTLVNGTGTGYYDEFIYVTIDPTSTPEAGDVYGPIEGEWFIGPGGTGFTSQGESLIGSDPLRCQFYRGGGTGGGSRVIFQCLDFDEELRIAQCYVLVKLCGGTVPDMDDYRIIEVHDPTGCYFTGEDVASMGGRRGWADYVQPIETSDTPLVTVSEYVTCFWAVSALCCQDIL